MHARQRRRRLQSVKTKQILCVRLASKLPPLVASVREGDRNANTRVKGGIVSTMSDSNGSGNYQGVPVISFQVGQQLPFDVYEQNEIMLLKKGSVITPRFLRNMRQRQLTKVFIRTQEIKELIPEAYGSRTGKNVDLETDASRELDEKNIKEISLEGASLIEQFKPRDAVPYDAEMVQNLISARDQDVNQLSEQLTEIVESSGEVAADDIEKVATRYIWNMVEDLDATLSVSQMARKGDYIANHSLQMSIMGMALAAEMGWPEREAKMTGVAGLVHDLGMARVPEEIREAPRRIGPLEFFEIMKHPIYTVDMIERVRGVPERCRVVTYQVHERQDGSGYPRRRTGERVYMIAKILGIVDAYLAMISNRPYRKALLPYHAMEKILEDARMGKWDPKVTRAFVKLIGMFPVGSFVMLSDESMAKVERSGGENFGKPQVAITHDADGAPQKSDALVDLAQEDEQEGIKIVKAIPPLFDFEDE